MLAIRPLGEAVLWKILCAAISRHTCSAHSSGPQAADLALALGPPLQPGGHETAGLSLPERITYSSINRAVADLPAGCAGAA